MEFEQRVAPAPSVEEVEVECAVRGIYPQPKIAVTWSDRCELNKGLAGMAACVVFLNVYSLRT